LKPPPHLSLIEAAYLLRSQATRRDLHFADVIPAPTSAPSPIHPPVEELPEPSPGTGSDHAFEAAVDFAFHRLERGVG
jgi:hypothetical protein